MAEREVGNLRTRLSWEDDGASNSLTGFRKDLQGLRSEMNSAKAGGKEYANSLKGLREQSDILTRKLKTQKAQVAELKKRYDESVKVKGEDNQQTRNLLKSYNNAVAGMKRTEQQLDRVTSAIDEQANPWKKLSRNAEEAGDRIKNVGEGMSNFGQTLSTNVTAPIVGLGTLAVESTRELRADMARLETNAKMAGVGVDVMEKSMRDLNAITGETDSNVEALSNLMATGMSDNQLLQAVDDLSGAVIKFPDTLKIEGLADGLQETLATGKAIGPFAELLERMGVDLEEFDKGLAEATETGGDLNYVLDELNKLDLSKVNDEFRETNKELIEGRNAQYDFMDAMSELGEKLEPIAARITSSTADIIDKFNELEPEVQDNILKFAGLAAAVGPVTMVLGSATTTIGNLTKGVGKLSGFIGKKGGKGLLGRFGLMGLTGGPVGLAIAGIAGLGLGISKLTEATNENILETAKSVESRKEEINQTDKLISRFEELKNKNKLSTDEVLRYMDIMSELKEAEGEKTIKKLTDEQAELAEKSGMSKDELAEFLKLNGELVQKTDEIKTAISEQGNAYASNLEKLKELTQTERERLTGDIYLQLTEELKTQAQTIERQKELQSEINSLKAKTSEHNANILAWTQQIQEKDTAIAELKDRIKNATGEEKARLIEKLGVEQLSREILQQDVSLEQEKIEKIAKQISGKQESLNKTNKELEAFDSLLADYAQMVLHEKGIVSEKGKAVETLRREQTEIDRAREKLRSKLRNEEISTAEYDRQNRKLDTQQGKIDGARDKLRRMNDVAGKTVYKDLEINPNPDIGTLNSSLSEPLWKRVNLDIPTAPVLQVLGYAEGTDYHPGGKAFVGEEGPELIKEGNKWSLAGFGLYDLDRGAKVFTHDESKRMLQSLNQSEKMLHSLNKIPGYAQGVSSNGEADRMIRQINNQQTNQTPDNQPIVLEIHVTSEIDGKAVGKSVEKHVTHIQQRKQARRRPRVT